MNKAIIYLVGLLMIASFASAVSINAECTNICGAGYSGIVKWGCDGGVWTLDPESPTDTGISVTGNCDSATWDVDGSGADGIIIKAGNIEHAEGSVYECNSLANTDNPVDIEKDISHLTFCSHTPVDPCIANPQLCDPCYLDPDSCNGVPEFSTMTLGLAIIGVGLGLAFLRKL